MPSYTRICTQYTPNKLYSTFLSNLRKQENASTLISCNFRVLHGRKKSTHVSLLTTLGVARVIHRRDVLRKHSRHKTESPLTNQKI